MRGPAKLTTIVTPAANYALVDLKTVKTLLNIADNKSDAYLTIIIPQAQDAATKYCGQVFAIETLLDQFWPERDGFPQILRDNIARLQLTRWPIVSVTSIVETIAGVATTLVAGTDYLVDAPIGQIIRLDRNQYPKSWSANPIAVTYSAGYPTTPPSLVGAIADLVKADYFARSRDPMLRQENAEGVYAATYWFGTGPGSDTDLPPEIMGKLDRFRPKVFA